MKIYVAAKYSDRDKVRIIYNILRKHGHEITLDWTNHDIYPNDAEAEQLAHFAEDDVKGVKDCDALIAYTVLDHPYKGLWCEMGIALGFGKPVYAIGHAGDSCIFMNHPLVTHCHNIWGVISKLEANH